ncbi:MAG TPA: ThiF family adenylyltransferase [Edaphobacter sp.]|uniref:ThiF family adenylyltransferase n=1 Tax=Edaphobacter sp. TaxID=1934404 RepID=UPI002D07CF54|nr:ThiF family adenylyltransferase [Edaphobacter sp.]HUZ96440.1 ThiF family adenylyltransferase [Edaphobacter sp.]
MSRAAYSIAMPGNITDDARAHLLRPDGQEDICFALWHPSRGRSRTTAVIHRLVLPRQGDRNVHGNASFEPPFFERALSEAAEAGVGLALMHSHPLGTGWQGMSRDDVRAEQGNAGAVLGATRQPFLGLTLAGDGAWSGRFWMRTAPRSYARQNCATVRTVGERLRVTYMDELAPPPLANGEQIRTVSAWGEEAQRDLVRLRIGVIGAGSVGGLIADTLVRTGFEDIMLIDFDRIEKHNLDRLSYATRSDIGKLKVKVQARHLAKRATADSFRVEPVVAAAYEDKGFRAALDCDVIFACVDRPWGRYILNLIAYAHLVPVIDGGIAARCNRLGKLAAADWKAHTATVGRPCLQCLGQYDPGFVQTERDGYLDDPSYIAGLPKDHPLKARENVFAFSMACASMQMLQMLALTLAPLGQSNPGAQLYHFVGNITEPSTYTSCHPECQFPGLAALGDNCGITATGIRTKGSNTHMFQKSIPRYRRAAKGALRLVNRLV